MTSFSDSSSSVATKRRGIPAAQVVEDVRKFLFQQGLDVNSSISSLQERIYASENSFYGVLLNFSGLRHAQKAQIPDIEKFLDVVDTLQAKNNTDEKAYIHSTNEDTDSVCLWLGANVMLEYSCVEAGALLHKNLDIAEASLEVLIADIQFLRHQVTVTQVTIASVYNWDVHERRIREAEAAAVKDS